jgi:RNA recognition motif-containing protein
MKKSLTFEDLKSRIRKPVFVIAITDEFKMKTGWHILFRINENKNRECLEFTDCHHIHLKNTHFFRFFDTEVSEEELAEILKEEEKSKKKTGYIYHCNDIAKVAREECANHFNDETLTKNLARAESLRYQLRRFAALNGGISSVEDWAYDGNWKYYIAYDYKNQKIYISCNTKYRAFGQIYFKSEEACKKAIETFENELLWYFTEFKEMLY